MRFRVWALFGLFACAHGPHPAPEGGVHVVRPGETIKGIAELYGVPVETLIRRNRLKNPDRIFVDQRITIPATETSTATQSVEEAEAEKEDQELEEAVERIERAEEEIPAAPEPSKPAKFIWPVDGVVISLFGEDDGARHDGVDIAAPEGTPVWAAADGQVLFAGEQKGYGLILILRHEGDWVTVYGHNLENLVKEKDQVKRGQPIAKVGSSGKQVTPALHFEVRKGAAAVNPLTELPNGT